MYNKLRPNRSTKTELVLMAQELLENIAPHCAKLVLEAAEIYEKGGILSLKLIAGVEYGNSTTEVRIGWERMRFPFPLRGFRMTTGTKGTLPNVHGIKSALLEALDKIRQPLSALDHVRLNGAACDRRYGNGDHYRNHYYRIFHDRAQSLPLRQEQVRHRLSSSSGKYLEGETGSSLIVVAANKFSYEEVAARLNQHIRNWISGG